MPDSGCSALHGVKPNEKKLTLFSMKQHMYITALRP